MTQERRHSSVFDDLLEHNRRELDSLTGGTSTSASPRASAPAARAPAAPLAVPERPAGRPGSPSLNETATGKALDERFGVGTWRFEIRERRREHEEFIVLGELSIPAKGIVRAQFGSARLDGAQRSTGSAGGVSFQLASSNTSSRRSEEETEHEAAHAALTRCMNLL